MRYLLFAGNYYYPDGGWNDFLAAANSLDEVTPTAGETPNGGRAKFCYCGETYEWYHIVDTHELAIIASENNRQTVPID